LLYPSIEPYNTGLLPVSKLHTIYYEECGNPNGQPAIFVHGGPGGGVSPEYRSFFDPAHYRIVLFDQRGCGKSTPHASIEENTTWDLVADMEKIREHLGIDKWLVFGGSWGSTLSLAYAETHPERCTHLVLRGIFLLRKWEIDWLYQYGASAIFPDFWEEYLKPIPENERHDMLGAYAKRLGVQEPGTRIAHDAGSRVSGFENADSAKASSSDTRYPIPDTRLIEAARAWSIWEGSTSKLLVDPNLIGHYGFATFATAFARIECHYFVNRGFMDEGQLLRDAHRIKHIPTVIVQGRYDIVCPMQSAWDLHRALPDAKLLISPTSGHSMMEPENRAALVQATDDSRV
jgi:proline iminopeptidase